MAVTRQVVAGLRRLRDHRVENARRPALTVRRIWGQGPGIRAWVARC